MDTKSDFLSEKNIKNYKCKRTFLVLLEEEKNNILRNLSTKKIWFINNRDPSELSVLHDWAEKNGLDFSVWETIILPVSPRAKYTLAIRKR